jgi:hypothetical protein
MSELAEGELNDREWRQMRRTLSKLEFEPVPETPPLLLRSLYAETPGKAEVQESITTEPHDLALTAGESSASIQSR